MTLFRTVLVTSGLALALGGGVAQSAQNAAANRPMMTLQMPATPEPARETLNPRPTALIVLASVEDICNSQPSCKGKMLPAMTPFMTKVRQAGMTVAYGTREQNQAHWLKEVSPAQGDIRITNRFACLLPTPSRLPAKELRELLVSEQMDHHRQV